MRMSRTTTAGLVLAAAIGCYQVTTLANGSAVGGGSSAPSSSAAERSPEEMARDSYNSGISHRDKGDKLEAAAEKDAKDRVKNLEKARDEYSKGMKDFEKASTLMPTMYQAYNGLGYTSRKTGDYTKALQMYDKALSLAPGFPDAIEYRGVAYLKLNRVEDAKKAYLDLFAKDRKQADELMKAMTQWVSDHQAEPGGVDATVVTGLSTWIQERSKIATTTAAMALTGHRSIWN
jgi:tetratricopeptide (TPR) repeat protein